MTTTIPVHRHPFGFVLDGIGLTLLLYAMFRKPVDSTRPKASKSVPSPKGKFAGLVSRLESQNVKEVRTCFMLNDVKTILKLKVSKLFLCCWLL